MVIPRSSVSLNIYYDSSSLWWTPPLDLSIHHRGSATSLHSSNNFTGWRRRSGLTSRSLFSSTSVYMGLRHLNSLMSSVVRRACKVEVVYVLRLHHSWLSIGPPTLLSAIGLSWSLVHGSGTTYRSMSLLLPRCTSLKPVLRLTCLRLPSLNYFVQYHKGGSCH